MSDGYAGDDFYCDVAIPSSDRLRVVHEDNLVLAFHHTKPFWETHVVVVPKPHLASLTSVTSADSEVLTRLFSVLQEVLRELESRCGAAAATVHVGGYQDSQHLHIHVHSGPRRPV